MKGSIALTTATLWMATCGSVHAAQPVVHDDRLELSLFAEHPQIVTPIGLAIDDQDRLFVLESHTHTPPKDYPGPKHDIVKVFTDRDGDGTADVAPKHFAEGIKAGMNLGFSRDGTLYVCAAWEVIALPDKDNDGKADENKVILKLETKNNYPHSAQMGIAFSYDDWIYISRGNNGSYGWVARGADGSSINGFGDGGNVYRCRLDGSDVQEVATGFWNSMNLKFDSHGRLLLVDNDPDARGPNRLVHIVEQGDYGHKSIFGGPGNHPFQGWDGTLPGTLGYVDGIGEAPCDLIDTDRTSFPKDYHDQLLVTVWNENSIARYTPKQSGTSITATHEIWMQGDENFRPVALEADSKGNLYITDWVNVAYPNHGQGRIWKVTTKERRSPIQRLTPRKYFDLPDEQPGAAKFAAFITTNESNNFPRLEKAVASDDPFIRHAAVVALARPVFHDSLPMLAESKNERARLGALLAMRRGKIANPEMHLQNFLRDSDENVRRAALMWIGEEGLLSLRSDIDQAIAFEDLSSTVFETYLAAIETLTPEFINGLNARRGKAKDVPRNLDPKVVENILRDEDRPDRVRALALILLKHTDSDATRLLLTELATDSTPVLQREAIRSLSESRADSSPLFLAIANDQSQPESIRAEAVLGLSKSFGADPTTLLPLLDDDSLAVRMETIRALRLRAYDEDIRPELEKRYAALKRDTKSHDLLEQYQFILEPNAAKRPTDVAGWLNATVQGGDVEAGERLFFANQTQCAGCHLIQNRGRRIGPELSNIGQSVTREQIVASIVQPSALFAPEFQAWFVELKDGDYFQGLQLDHGSNGSIAMYTTEGITRRWKGPEIAGYGVLPRSLMPDGLEQTMTVGEMRDLVAFLESLN